MENKIKIPFGADFQSILQEEKLKFLRGALESLGVDVSDWDMNCTYDVDLRIFLRKLAADNHIAINEDNNSIEIINLTKKYEWRIKDKLLYKEKDKVYNVFVIETVSK
jgi:hypothetical protein